MLKNLSLNKKASDRLYQALLSLKTKEECAAFLRDLCTPAEIQAMAERFAAAEGISRHEPYRQIADDINVSTATVVRVAQWFNNGTGGYPLVINRLQRKS